MPRRNAPLVLITQPERPQATPLLPSPRPTTPLRRLGLVAAAVLLSVAGLAPAAAAEPLPPEPGPSEPAPAPDPIEFEGGTDAMRQQLDETQSAWWDAKAQLDASTARQEELTQELVGIEAQMKVQGEALGKVARMAYLSGNYMKVAALMTNDTVGGFLDNMGLVQARATHETNIIQQLAATHQAAESTRAGIEQESATQQALLADMDARKQQAQLALCQAAVGSCDDNVGGVFSVRASAVAAPAPRNADGSWPVEYLPRDRVSEVTITGTNSGYYITPRTAHAVVEAKKADFTIFVACFGYRNNVSEHPKGRACDFAVDASCHYCGAAQGANKTYGDDLADFLVFNAERLGVLYVIWYQRIWLASTGQWKPYSGAHGDSSSNHTNHVHMSIK